MSKDKPNLGGRPSLYKPEYIEKMLDFFRRDYTMVVDNKREACNFPSIARFAVNIGVNKSTIYEWADKHPQFSVALKKCKEMQEDIIVNNSLKGSYNANFAQFLLKNNFAYKDKHEVEQKTEIKIVLDNEDTLV